MEDRKKLGNKLREAREYLKLSQEEVAGLTGLPRSAISLIESGSRKVEALELKKLAEVYRTSVAHLTQEEAPKTAELPATVKRLAQTAEQLSSKDQEELLQFANFLQSRTGGKGDAEK